jgi:lipid A 4'-phosphatase
VTTPTFDHAEQDAGVGSGRDTRLIWAGLFLSLAVFAKVPALDLWVSHYWWRPELGFYAAQTPWVQFCYIVTPRAGHALLAMSALMVLLYPWAVRWARANGRDAWAPTLSTLRRTGVAGLLVGVLANGVLVELTFKGHVGRPRPVQTVDFGGQRAFQGVFETGPDAQNHKSFTSGHAAAAFSLMAIGLAAGPTWRRRWFWLGLLAGSVVGLGRIIQGGHYLSDVIFSFYIVWLSCELVAYAFKRYDLSQLPPHHPDRIGPRSALR